MHLAIPFLSVDSFYFKHTWDAMRAVDVLAGLDCVDATRIGMIGHSLGAGTTFWAAAMDERVRAAVLSCHFLAGLGGSPWYQAYGADQAGVYYHEMLAAIAPRAVLATRGCEEDPVRFSLDTPEAVTDVMEWAFDFGRLVCALCGGPAEAMQCQVFDGGHEFPEAQRKYAYRWLKAQLMYE